MDTFNIDSNQRCFSRRDRVPDLCTIFAKPVIMHFKIYCVDVLEKLTKCSLHRISVNVDSFYNLDVLRLPGLNAESIELAASRQSPITLIRKNVSTATDMTLSRN